MSYPLSRLTGLPQISAVSGYENAYDVKRRPNCHETYMPNMFAGASKEEI